MRQISSSGPLLGVLRVSRHHHQQLQRSSQPHLPRFTVQGPVTMAAQMQQPERLVDAAQRLQSIKASRYTDLVHTAGSTLVATAHSTTIVL
jgi:hypothetical protein